MLFVSMLLFLLRLIGLAVMIPFTRKTKSDWKIPALEIIMRAMYLVAVVSGGMLMNLHGIAALSIAHKISALAFLALLLVVYIPKWKE